MRMAANERRREETIYRRLKAFWSYCIELDDCSEDASVPGSRYSSPTLAIFREIQYLGSVLAQRCSLL